MIDASPAGKIEWLLRADRAARAVDPRVRGVIATFDEEIRRTAVVTSEGVIVDDVQPMTTFRVQAIAQGLQTWGDDIEVKQPLQQVTIKLNRPQEQYSIYK